MLLLFVLVLCQAVSSVQCADWSMLQDCAVMYRNVSTQSGVYSIYPVSTPVKVYCDMDTDGGGWTVIQRRMDGGVNFHRPWTQYKVGFGNPAGEFWLGLDHMHLLTGTQRYHLRLDLEDFQGNTAFAFYSVFSVGSEAEGYRLQVSGFQDGGAGDSMTHRNGTKFSTFDQNQEQWSHNCANQYYGAFWQSVDNSGCHYSNPNGFYLWGEMVPHKIFCISMKIRRDF